MLMTKFLVVVGVFPVKCIHIFCMFRFVGGKSLEKVCSQDSKVSKNYFPN